MSKEKSEIIKEYKDKIQLLKKYDNYYHNKDAPLVTDRMYDNLKKEVINLKNSHHHLKKFSSILNKVGYTPSEKFKKVKHLKPMLSLSNAFDKNDMKEF